MSLVCVGDGAVLIGEEAERMDIMSSVCEINFAKT